MKAEKQNRCKFEVGKIITGINNQLDDALFIKTQQILLNRTSEFESGPCNQWRVFLYFIGKLLISFFQYQEMPLLGNLSDIKFSYTVLWIKKTCIEPASS